MYDRYLIKETLAKISDQFTCMNVQQNYAILPFWYGMIASFNYASDVFSTIGLLLILLHAQVFENKQPPCHVLD